VDIGISVNNELGSFIVEMGLLKIKLKDKCTILLFKNLVLFMSGRMVLPFLILIVQLLYASTSWIGH
jgi:hypothetical protein